MVRFTATTTIRVRVGRERPGTLFPFFFIQRERRYRCFFCSILQLLTVIFHGSPSVIKLIRLLLAFMHVNNNDN